MRSHEYRNETENQGSSPKLAQCQVQSEVEDERTFPRTWPKRARPGGRNQLISHRFRLKAYFPNAESLTRNPSLVRLALRLLSAGHAAPSAHHRRKLWKNASPFPRSSHGGRMDTGLRRRWRSRPAASTSSFYLCECDAIERFRRARKSTHIHSDCEQRNGYKRQLERERCCRRKFGRRNHLVRRRLHRTHGFAFSCHSPNHGNQPSGQHQVRLRQCNDNERRHPVADSQSGKRGTGRDATVSSRHNEQWPSRHPGSLEFVRRGVPEFMRHGGLQRHIHSPRNFAVIHKRHAHSPKRGRSFKTNLRNSHHHQQFFLATFCAIKRSCRNHHNPRGHTHSSAQLQSQHRARLVA